MLEKQNKITIEELKTYLYSLEDEKKQAKDNKINIYKVNCEENHKKMKQKEIQKIKREIAKEYKERFESRDRILALIEECSSIPEMVEKLNVSKYMVYRVNVRGAQNVLEKAEKKIGRRYNDIVTNIEDELDVFPKLDNIEEIDFSVYKPNTKSLEEAKEKYKEEYTEEERRELIQNELNIIEQAKIFNTTPIPHEILKNSDRDIQSKMQKFNNIRQKRLKILSTMEEEYVKLEEPREINSMIDDAILNIEETKEIFTKSEYSKVKSSLIKKRKKVYRSTKELRNTISYKEKKSGIIDYNIQEARYGRMETLRNIITGANAVIKANIIPGAEEQLKKLKVSYEREKQYAAVIEKLEEEAGNGVTQNAEVKAYEEQIETLEYKINNSRKIIKEQEEKIEKAKKELIILWKMEIDTTISRKKESLELPQSTQNSQIEENLAYENRSSKVKTKKNFFMKLKKAQGGKHACV